MGEENKTTFNMLTSRQTMMQTKWKEWEKATGGGMN